MAMANVMMMRADESKKNIDGKVLETDGLRSCLVQGPDNSN